jgi:TonB family protein
VVAEKRCLSCPPPKLPPAFVQLGVEQKVVVKTCVGAQGNVTSVDVVRGLGPLADASVVDTVRGWRFSPHSVGDHPVPFCYPTRFVFTMN